MRTLCCEGVLLFARIAITSTRKDSSMIVVYVIAAAVVICACFFVVRARRAR